MAEIDNQQLAKSGRLVCWGIGIFGAALLGFSAFSIYGFVDAVARRAPIIVWYEHGWTGLPIALSLLALALCLYIGRNHGPDTNGWRSEAIKYLLALSACLLPFVIVLPLSAHWFAGMQLEARGYSACDEGMWVAVGRVPDTEAALARCDVLRQA